jgi:hypothetical protein
MGLSKDEWKRRLEAALALRDKELSDLKYAVHEQGLPVNAAARAGHASDTLQPSHALAVVVAELLDMPVAWFEDEEWRTLVTEPPAEGEEALVALVRRLAERQSVLLSRLESVQREQERQRTLLLRLLPPESGTNN